jgi:predicted rRNA methylase YqxC with S4 and FtsJ domains
MLKRMKMKNNKSQVYLIYTNLNLPQAKRKAAVKPQFRKNRALKAKMMITRNMKTIIKIINTIKNLKLKV